MTNVLIPLAQGCEEMEAIILIDVLRRAGINVVTAALDAREVTGSHNTTLIADTMLEEVKEQNFDMVVLPGGGPGSDALNNDPRVHDILKRHVANGIPVGAICAAPKVLSNAGLTQGRKITAYPGVLDNTPGMNITGNAVEKDGNILTSRGPGTAMDFALEIVETLHGKAQRDKVEAALVRN